MERYGYIRVSAKDQNPERQFLAMQEQQIKQKNIYLDKMSGKSFARPQYLRMLKRVRKVMKIILDNDATVVDYHKFIEKYAIPYLKKKYNMDVVHEDELELEDIFDCKNVLIKRGYSEEDADKQVKEIVDKFWVSPRYIVYSMPWMFFPKAAKTLRILKKQGHRIEIHTSKMKACELNIIGRITRFLMYLQYWGNGIFIPCRNFKFYKNDEMKGAGIINASPDIVFEDKSEIIDRLLASGVKCLCVSGKHNQTVIENKCVNRLSNYEYDVVDETIGTLFGEKKWKLYKDIAKSDIAYKRLLKLKCVVRRCFKPIVINEGRLKNVDNRGVIYVSNHRSTLDPIILTAIIDEPIRYAALKRFFDAEDSIFNNNKNMILCRLTASVFKSLKFFPIERLQDNDNANNAQSIRDMVDYANIKGKVGIFPEGTTLKNHDEDFGIFNDSFVKLAALTNSVIQPITIYWFRDKGKRKCIVNFGDTLEVRKNNMLNVYDEFVQCQKELLRENKAMAENLKTM